MIVKLCFHCDKVVFTRKPNEIKDCNSYRHTGCANDAYICRDLALSIIRTNNHVSNKKMKLTNPNLQSTSIKQDKIIECVCGEILTHENIKSNSIGLVDACLIM